MKYQHPVTSMAVLTLLTEDLASRPRPRSRLCTGAILTKIGSKYAEMRSYAIRCRKDSSTEWPRKGPKGPVVRATLNAENKPNMCTYYFSYLRQTRNQKDHVLQQNLQNDNRTVQTTDSDSIFARRQLNKVYSPNKKCRRNLTDQTDPS